MILYRSSHKQESGTEVYIDGSKSSASRIDINTLQFVPTEYGQGHVVLLNNEVHFIQTSTSTTNMPKHYKWNGTTWSQVSTLPYPVGLNAIVVYNNEIHLIGSTLSTYSAYHYKWNGTSWVNVSTIPISASGASAVVYNNEIHIFFADELILKYHYKWDGTEWTLVENNLNTLTITMFSYPVVYNNEIHLFGQKYEDTPTLHYKWNGSSWTQLTSPLSSNSIIMANVVVYNNEIHYIFGKYHAKWNGTTWTDLPNTKFYHTYYMCLVYDNKLYGFGYINGSAIEIIGSDFYYEE